jgi:Fic family protein
MTIPVSPRDLLALTRTLIADGPRFERVLGLTGAPRIGPAPDGKYRHWDTLRHLEPPPGWTAEELWYAVKSARRHLYQPLPLRDTTGGFCRFALVGPVLELLHQVDRDAGGNTRGDTRIEQVTSADTRDTYLFTSLMEEAITSSQLEGASTTRRVAKAMLQEGREPRDRSERMIFNNYRAMRYVRESLDRPLDPSMVLSLHRILTEGTLDEPGGAGRFRTAEEHIVVSDERGHTLHTPPAAADLPERLKAMCSFANGEGDEFIPPAIRAIVLHFWLAYDHPFVDGNGRTARALFYWSMARQGYWLAEFVSISRILRKAHAQYARAFLYCETDDNDLTYFILYHLRVLTRAIDDLHDYLARKSKELRDAERLLTASTTRYDDLNPRQLALVSHALKHSEARYTIESHRTSHGISYETARSDLLALERLGLLEKRKRGRAFHFLVPVDLHHRVGAGKIP